MTVLVFFPPLRHFVTPLLKERIFVWLPLRGAVDAVDCGVAFLCFMLLPPLRHFVTPLLKERFFVRLPLRGAVDAVDCGCFLMLFLFATTPSLRDTSPQGEAFCMAPIEVSCRRSRMRGGYLSFPLFRQHINLVCELCQIFIGHSLTTSCNCK